MRYITEEYGIYKYKKIRKIIFKISCGVSLFFLSMFVGTLFLDLPEQRSFFALMVFAAFILADALIDSIIYFIETPKP